MRRRRRGVEPRAQKIAEKLIIGILPRIFSRQNNHKSGQENLHTKAASVISMFHSALRRLL
jgi:hypothetical protein